MKGNARLYNLLASILAGLTLLVCVGTAAIFVDPTVFFNPFKPVRTEDLPPVLTEIVPLPTATAGDTVRAPVVNTATSSPSPLPSTTPAEGVTEVPTQTPFPSPVGPTETTVPTDVPTQTASPLPPKATPTPRTYPGGPTETPQATAYP